MKKSINFILSIILALVLNACSDKMNDSENFNLDEFLKEWDINTCSSVTDAVEYPTPWNVDVDKDFVIPIKTIRSMSTCGLLVTMLNNPSLYTHDKSEIRLAPWHPASSNHFDNGITKFNTQLGRDPMAVELFERSDCFPVLASKYLTFIKEKEKLPVKQDQMNEVKTIRSNDLPYFEMLLASDLCMSALNETEINQIMAMALAYEEKAKYNGYFVSETYNIMISIMLWHNYAPFIEEVSPRLRESTLGYCLTNLNGNLESNILATNVSDSDDIYLILKYAKGFFNEQNL